MTETLSYWFAWQEVSNSKHYSEPKKVKIEGPFSTIFDAKIMQFTFSLSDTNLSPVFRAIDRNSAAELVNHHRVSDWSKFESN